MRGKYEQGFNKIDHGSVNGSKLDPVVDKERKEARLYVVLLYICNYCLKRFGSTMKQKTQFSMMVPKEVILECTVPVLKLSSLYLLSKPFVIKILLLVFRYCCKNCKKLFLALPRPSICPHGTT
jgi:hypothetical protein